MPATWHVLRTRPQAELAVRDHLAAAGLEPFVPLAERWRRNRGYLGRRHLELTDTPLLSRYVFLGQPVDNWPAALAVPGVAGVLCMDGAPAVIRDGELAELRLAARRAPIRPGDSVAVELGPFAGQVLAVASVSVARRSITADVTLLGSRRPVAISIDMLAA